MKPILILISGFSCTGKTTLAKKIAQRYSLPLIGRDEIKESLYDSLGYSNREWSKKLGIASYDLLYLFVDKLLVNKQSLITESNFKSKIDTAKLLKLQSKYQFNLLQIHCYTSVEIALQRFKNRATSEKRHPGHVDHLIYEEMEENWRRGGYEILDICDRTIKIDTTDFNSIDYDKIHQTIEANLK
ncbi:AAA family ATPase [Pleurocapsa sp. PCC 7319]|uniref:AAA family ATPase n=1 Tax=Pleurocapsa sp. PCC 7319 TaxID=118161 RepID=UPI00034B7454|nr:AAA family ATPase [Pleurocapsa sp. PCC 7319]